MNQEEENEIKLPNKSYDGSPLSSEQAMEGRNEFKKEFANGIAILLSMKSNTWVTLNEKRAVENIPKDDEFHIQFETLLGQFMKGSLTLKVEEFNSILLYLSLTSHYDNHDILKIIISLLLQKNSDPTMINETTFAIVIPALLYRLNAPNIASEFILDTDSSKSLLQNPLIISQAMLCLKQSQSCESLEKFFRNNLKDTKDSYTLKLELAKLLLGMYKTSDKMLEAIDLINDFTQETNLESDYIPLLNSVVLWPSRKNNGEPSDLLTIHTFVFKKLQSCDEFQDTLIRNRIWNDLISILAKSIRLNSKSNSSTFLHGVIWHFLKMNTKYHLHASTVTHALKIASLHQDAELSVELLQHILESQSRKKFPLNTDSIPKKSIPLEAFELALSTSVTGKCSDSLSKIYSMLNDSNLDFPRPLVINFMNQIISGFAYLEEFEKAKSALFTMMDQKSLMPSDEAVASLIRGLSTHQQPNTALEFLQSLQKGKFGKIQPGSACYDAKFLVYARRKDWYPILVTFQEEVKGLKLKPTPFILQCVLLASFRLGGKTSAVAFMENEIKSGGHVNRESFLQLMQCLLPELCRESIHEIRLQLRNLYETTSDKSVAKYYLDLSRTLRIAEQEDDRAGLKGKRHYVKDNRVQAWTNVHKSVLELYRAM
jgi:hypothetical protein